MIRKRDFQLTVGIAIALPVLSTSCLWEVRGERYATLAEAEAAGALRRGWIPEFLPASAVEIEEVHDLETNLGWIRFRAAAGDIRVMIDSARPISLGHLSDEDLLIPRPPRDWPSELKRPLMATPRANFKLYTARDSHASRCIALLEAAEMVWVWNCAAGGA